MLATSNPAPSFPSRLKGIKHQSPINEPQFMISFENCIIDFRVSGNNYGGDGSGSAITKQPRPKRKRPTARANTLHTLTPQISRRMSREAPRPGSDRGAAKQPAGSIEPPSNEASTEEIDTTNHASKSKPKSTRASLLIEVTDGIQERTLPDGRSAFLAQSGTPAAERHVAVCKGKGK